LEFAAAANSENRNHPKCSRFCTEIKQTIKKLLAARSCVRIASQRANGSGCRIEIMSILDNTIILLFTHCTYHHSSVILAFRVRDGTAKVQIFSIQSHYSPVLK